MAVLSREQARRVYDRIGARQDTQAFYEDRATAILVVHGHFRDARQVFEFGLRHGSVLAARQVDELVRERVAQVVGDVGRGEAQEVTRGHLVLHAVDLGMPRSAST
jgi:hypothetical protein